ncbi:ABC transporter ATP-binding protein [Pontibacter akesuensis]|uniref:ABC-2 type transport system ATP-binding protein n=1 Tax=Pontibacter akesuensis TaxID=388950 RepID=A0A1I7GCP3_9BACT|nr:ATP-binding cassette domain-containing protein [Pontibacter akesuensis]GHA57543.1 ABC transporter ATP-binding protein [Pontibacter akesuensis]SFU46227.1 ABC-2 type transport system ATP-binding protein [Pontibacter akesuensis]
MKKNIIETHGLSFSFGNRQVLHNLQLRVPKGAIFGFLGPNGAGKSTTIRILLGLLPVPKGQVLLHGLDLKENRIHILSRTGALIEMPTLYRHLSGYDNLEMHRRMVQAPKARIAEVLQTVGLTQDAKRKTKEYSLGMSQRLGIALALLADPELLILDEPTNGLDPSGIREIRELIIRLNRDFGKTIFLSSHLLSEIEKCATELAIIDKGATLYQGSLQNLYQSAFQTNLLQLETNNNTLAHKLLSDHQYHVLPQEADSVTVQVQHKTEVASLNRLLVENGLEVYRLSSNTQNLEELFLHITNADAAAPATRQSEPAKL